MNKTKKRINKRKVVSLTLLLSAIMMPVSALITHIRHNQEVVSHKWLHYHFVFGVIFVVSSIFHVVYNWKTLKHYLTGKKNKA
jgi:hypothetical protein